MNFTKLNKLRLRKWFWHTLYRLSGMDYPFEIVYTTEAEFDYPTDCKKVLAEFNVGNRYYLIYVSKEK